MELLTVVGIVSCTVLALILLGGILRVMELISRLERKVYPPDTDDSLDLPVHGSNHRPEPRDMWSSRD